MSQLNGVYVDANNKIYVRCGDSGTITLTGIPTDENYKASLGIYNPLTKQIIAETSANTGEHDFVSLNISSEMTESIGAGNYFYAIKLAKGDSEQTVLPRIETDAEGNMNMPLAPTFFVSPKMVEG